MIFQRILIFVLLLWVFTYTASFGIWTWKRKNKLGAVMVFFIALASAALPIYAMFFKE